MKIASHIAAGLLALVFVVLPSMFLLKLMPTPPPPPEGSPSALFMGAFGPTGYMTFVLTFEIIGGLLVAIPKTRNLGLLVLGPIILNILAFHLLIAKEGLVGMPLFVAFLALFLLWCGRKAFAGLLN